MAVHRFKANESTESEKKSALKPATKKVAQKPKATTKAKAVQKTGPLRGLKNYFVGSWQELRQVRWPNRKQTWALTLAVLLFSLFFGGLIFLLDLAFTYLFKQVIF